MVAVEHVMCCLVSILLSCDGDELLGGFGNVISTLDDLLGDKLHVRPRGAVQRHRFPALVLKAGGAGGQQAQRAFHCLGARLLWEEGSHLCYSHIDSF